MTWFVRATGHELSPEISICRGFSKKGRATNGHSNLEKASVKTTQPVDLQGKSLSGSDGTRTRDLRRDRPSRVPRHPATTVSERADLQALFALAPPPLRMVEPIVESTFGPRVGHRILSSRTTPRREGHRLCCGL